MDGLEGFLFVSPVSFLFHFSLSISISNVFCVGATASLVGAVRIGSDNLISDLLISDIVSIRTSVLTLPLSLLKLEMEIKFPFPLPPSTCSARILFFSSPFASLYVALFFLFLFGPPTFLLYLFPLIPVFHIQFLLFSFPPFLPCLDVSVANVILSWFLAGSAGPWFPSLVLPWFGVSNFRMSTCL